MCPEEDSGRTREVIAAKYTVDRREEPVEFLSSTILGRAKGEKEKKIDARRITTWIKSIDQAIANQAS